MAVYELTLPVDNETIEKLHVGDIIYLNGQVCTARDQAHLRLKALDEAGKPFPEDLKCAAIFHAGPVMKKDEAGHWYLSVIGPTTSIRMEPYADFIGRIGVKILIGKGGMAEGTRKAMQKYKQVYAQAVPGCAVVLAKGVTGTKDPYWYECGMPEAMWPLQTKHFGPFLITMDSYGKSTGYKCPAPWYGAGCGRRWPCTPSRQSPNSQRRWTGWSRPTHRASRCTLWLLP